MKQYVFLLSVLFLSALAVAVVFSCGDDDDDDDDKDDGDDDSSDDDTSDDDDTTDDDDDSTDDDDDSVDWGDWWPPPAGTSVVYEVLEWKGGTYDLTAEIIGQETYNGGTYTKFQLGDFTADDIIGIQGWLDLSTEGQFGFAGSEIYWSNDIKSDTEPEGVFDLDAPVYIYINPTLNDPKESTASGTWDIYNQPGTYDATLISTTLSTDASVTVPYGTVDDCFEVKVDFWQQFSLWPDVDGSTTFYFHSELGLVMTSGANMMGFSLKLKDIQ